MTGSAGTTGITGINNITVSNGTPSAVCYDQSQIWVGTDRGNFDAIQINSGAGTAINGPIVCQSLICVMMGCECGAHMVANQSSLSYFNTSPPNTINNMSLTGATGYGICAADGSVWVAGMTGSNGVVYRFNTSGIVGTTPVGSLPVKPCYDGTSIWVANNGSNSVSRLTTAGTLANTYGTTGVTGPYWMCTDGSNLYVSSSLNGTIGQYNIQTSPPSFTNSVSIGASGANAQVCFDGQYLWATAPSTNQVIQMQTNPLSIVNTYVTGAGPSRDLFR